MRTSHFKYLLVFQALFLLRFGSHSQKLDVSSSICEEYLRNINLLSQSAVSCITMRTAPTSFCGWCVDNLVALKVLLENTTVVNEWGVPCIDIIFESSQESIRMIEFISMTWNQSYCPHCLGYSVGIQRSSRLNLISNWPILSPDAVPAHSTVLSIDSLYNLSHYQSNVVQFFLKLNDTLDCFMQYLNDSSVSLLEVLSFPAPHRIGVNQSVCENCSALYGDLLDFYNKELMQLNLEESEIQMSSLSPSRFSVCMDVQYALNRTQWIWFNLFHCRNPDINSAGFILPLLVCIVILLLFHVLNYSICRQPLQVVIYRPKRVEPRVHSDRTTFGNSTFMRQPFSTIQSYGSMATVSLSPNEVAEEVERI